MLPTLHFPASVAANALLRTRALSCVEWGLCVASGSGNTARSIPRLAGPAQQVCKGMTHAQTPRESAISPSGSCMYSPACHPATPEVSPLPSPQVVSKGKTSPRGLHLPFSFANDENDFLPATVDSVCTVIKRLHPHVPVTLRLNLQGFSREPTLNIWTTRTTGLRRESGFSSTCHHVRILAAATNAF